MFCCRIVLILEAIAGSTAWAQSAEAIGSCSTPSAQQLRDADRLAVHTARGESGVDVGHLQR